MTRDNLDSIEFGPDRWRPELHAGVFTLAGGMHSTTVTMTLDDLHTLRDRLARYLEHVDPRTKNGARHTTAACVLEVGDGLSVGDGTVAIVTRRYNSRRRSGLDGRTFVYLDDGRTLSFQYGDMLEFVPRGSR